ncbi:lysophospholipid acyltransferase family protein [Aestuariibius insulae]|uniref:lysophospholipid acyltransferase family protein n=1 Tax=Aestuariibius insulae TaxID=2058287 RepID=UPI00345E1F04
MTQAWYSETTPPEIPSPGLTGWLRIVPRAAVLLVILSVGLALLVLLRLIERPLNGLRRPVTPYITQGVCRLSLLIIGLRLMVHDRSKGSCGTIVANHASWLDIFVLNAVHRVYFVSKSEVANWPFIGWLARATGTVFIDRDRKTAARQRDQLRERLEAGHQLVLFAEGTSTDGRRVLPFKSSLFDAFLTSGRRAEIVPTSVVYRPHHKVDDRLYGWWGDMEFGSHLLRILAMPHKGRVDVVLHPPIIIDEMADRKTLARTAETAVRHGLEEYLT